MPTVTFIESNGNRRAVEGKPGRSLMQIALAHAVPGILGDCGGSCSCGTCHGYIDPAWADKLPPISETEAFMLDAVPEPRTTSRLCCQIPMSDVLDGIVVTLPDEQA